MHNQSCLKATVRILLLTNSDFEPWQRERETFDCEKISESVCYRYSAGMTEGEKKTEKNCIECQKHGTQNLLFCFCFHFLSTWRTIPAAIIFLSAHNFFLALAN